MNHSTIATVGAAIAIAISGWFANCVSTLTSKVEVVSTAQAATSQKSIDIDARLTRIENKIDQLSMKAQK